MSDQGTFRRAWCLCVLVVTGAVAGTVGAEWVEPGKTYWQGPAGVAGDWWDAANWSAGVPDNNEAYIGNGGIGEISGGEAEATLLHVGYESGGMLRQKGGTLRLGDELFVGGDRGAAGAYVLGEGEISASCVVVGQWGGDGLVVQLGGRLSTSDSLVVGSSVSGFGPVPVSWHGDEGTARARYIQLGGSSEPLRLWVGHPWRGDAEAGEASYELLGGQLRSQLQDIDRHGLFAQSGGVNMVEYLAIRGGRYAYTGGELQVIHGLSLFDGTLDFGHAATALNVDGALLNFAASGTGGSGQIVNAERASLSAGANSLVILPQGFDPQQVFGHFSNVGLTHYAGTELTIPADRRVQGAGPITDFTHVYGEISGTSTWGQGIDLLGGAFIYEGGHVVLGSGQLRVVDQNSGMSGGYLEANGYLNIGTFDANVTRSGRFTQSGGVNASERVNVISGRYDMSGGEVSTWIMLVGSAPFTKGVFTQTGGSVRVDSLLAINRGSVDVLGGEFYARQIEIGSPQYETSARLAIHAPKSVIRGEDVIIHGNGTLDMPYGNLDVQRLSNRGLIEGSGTIVGQVINEGRLRLHGFLGGGPIVLDPPDRTIPLDGGSVIFRPLSGGLAIHGNYTQTGDGRMDLFLSRVTGLPVTDETISEPAWEEPAPLTVAGRATLGGTLSVVLTEIVYVGPYPGGPLICDQVEIGAEVDVFSLLVDRYKLMTYGSREGQFDLFLLSSLFLTRTEYVLPPARLYYGEHDLWLLLGTKWYQGDFNNDGFVNALDISPFLLALTDPQRFAEEHADVNLSWVDMNGDGVLNALDVSRFLQRLQAPLMPELRDGPQITMVPEPGAVGLLAVGVLVLYGRRRA